MRKLNLTSARVTIQLLLSLAAVLMSVFAVIGSSPASQRPATTSQIDPISDATVPTTLAPDVVTNFSTGSLIIPMDISASGQDNGMLRAYGLVYELLRNGVPVHWVINPSKAVNGDDFAISMVGAIQDFRTGASVTTPRSYRGGPFVIAASNAAAATPIIQAWQVAVGDNTAVHRFVGAGSFSADVSRLLIRAPRIAILKDGNETIAFNNLNAAGILDSIGALWTSSSPNLLTESDVAGPTTVNHADGALFHPGGLDRYCYIASMHYITTSFTPEVIQEVRSSLDGASLEHAFMQCEAARTFENDSVGGFFLTTLGLTDDGSATSTPVIRVPSNPLAQLDGTFEADSGAVDSIGLVSGSTFRTGVTTLINESSATLLQRIVLLSGRLDGNDGNGRVTYLAGHDYALDLPVSSNPQTNGVRLFLNSIFESDCATDAGQSDVALTVIAPALTNSNTIGYTVNYSNPGPRPVENVKLTDRLPAGTTYVLGSGVPAPTTNAGGVLTWNLPPLGSGANGSVSFQVSVTSDGTYNNTAQMDFAHLTVRHVSSAPATTVRDTVAPLVIITGGPTGSTNDATPTFSFTVSADAVSTQCRVDADSFVPCTSSFTTAILIDGPHTFTVRAFDAAGNQGQASQSFAVDTVSPLVTITGGPTGTTNDTTPTFSFVASPDTVSTECHVDSDPFVVCTSPYTSMALADGPHTFTVRALDAATNVGQASRSFAVNSVALVSITVTPTNPSVPAGSTLQFTAIGTFSDASNQDLTTDVTWSSSQHTVATISNASGSEGLATGQSPGMTQIRAQLDSTQGSTTLTVTSAPTLNISGSISYCSNPSPPPVSGVTLTLSGSGSDSTVSDGSGNYTLSSITSGGTYTVTPSKDALAPTASGIDTLDTLAVHRHYLNITPLPAGCPQTAADVNGDSMITTLDAVAIQRFYIGRTFGTASVGQHKFSPASRNYPAISGDQTGQNYDALIVGDVTGPFVNRPGGPLRDITSVDTNPLSTLSVAISLPEVSRGQSKFSNRTAAITSSSIDAQNNLVAFQGDFAFDERMVTFQNEPVQKAGLTGGNWSVMGNVLPGTGPIRTLRVSAFSTDFTPLTGSGPLFELKLSKMSKTAQSTQLIWAAQSNDFIFIDRDLNVRRPISER